MMLLTWILLGTFLTIYTKCHSGLARLNFTSVAEEKVILKAKTLDSKNEIKSKDTSLISHPIINKQSRNPGRFIEVFCLQLCLFYYYLLKIVVNLGFCRWGTNPKGEST